MSKIQWTERTWNPVRGCSIVSPGCINCYAMKQAHRFSGEGRAYHGLTKQTAQGPQWIGNVVCDEVKLLDPLSWRKPCRVFVNSMSDLFHESVPDAFIDRVFAVMALAPEHTFQILTKRAQRMRDYLSADRRHEVICREMDMPPWLPAGRRFPRIPEDWPMPNVWLGVSCENQQTADERIPLLLETPARMRFVSAEPLIGPMDMTFRVPNGDDGHMPALAGLDWVIIGGESGPRARRFDIQWARDLIAECRRAGVYPFVKQLGSNPDNGAQPDGGLIRAYIRDRKGGDPSEWPEDLRVREFPA